MPLRVLVALMACVSLSGCLGSAFGADRTVQRDVMRTVSLFDGDIVVRGPDGYCIDRRSLRKRAKQGFVLIASCEALSGVRGQEVEPVIMTLTVLPGQAGQTRPASRDIVASMPELTVLDEMDADDLSLVHFADGGDQALSGKDPRHWRGAMTVNGHLIGLALYARKGSRTAGKDGQDLLSDLARNTQDGSPIRPLIVPPAPAQTGASQPGTLRALLNGLFPNSS